ncbi:CAP domain-containing protein [Fulvivirga sp. RKSG066]|uniref:CAP domain-containing protein n=1 Tax=Fulvivirga aurantia TaxID=2529383 RepID=UPI0012BBACEF|nr:CAP domain-containing protein [Fulvivirga aurantia]MTI21156.1 CAP domain-containing protein [Fulvivirga aurantia]
MYLSLFNGLLIALNFLFTSPSTTEKVDVCLSTEEAKLYELINDYRKQKRLTAIPYSAKLSLVAQMHAKDLADNYDFDPNNKCNPHSWSKKGKWSSCCYTNDHKEAQCMWDKPKEIAGYQSPGYEIAYYSSAGASASEGLDGWKRSPSHNPLLINTDMWKKVKWQGVGVGIYKEYAVVWFGQLNDDQNNVVICE